MYGNSDVVHIEQITTRQITDYDSGVAGIHLYRLASVSARRRLGKQIVTNARKEASL